MTGTEKGGDWEMEWGVEVMEKGEGNNVKEIKARGGDERIKKWGNWNGGGGRGGRRGRGIMVEKEEMGAGVKEMTRGRRRRRRGCALVCST